ncbi:MAG: hypothetical protein D6766_01715 [Verrucomicrobia bacterium]|nr:MAG: hypothetical protein D6766_01715 [Verrucomicrobiota bacterium]
MLSNMIRTMTSRIPLPTIRLAWAALAVTLACGPSRAADPDTVELVPKWPVGKRLVTRINVEQNQRIQGAGPRPVSQQISQEQEIAIDVLRVNDRKETEMEARFQAMKMQMRMGGAQLFSYDSQNRRFGEVNPVAEAMDRLLEARLKLFADEQGRVTRVEGIKEMLESMDTRGMAGQMLKGMFNEDAVKQMGMLPQGFPYRKVKLGESWTSETSMAAGPVGTIKVQMQHTFDGWETRGGIRCARITYTGTITSGAAEAAGNSALSFDIQGGRLRGTNWFDPELGQVREGTSDVYMKLNITAGAQQMSIDLSQKVTNKLIAVGSAPGV